jgi:hypothetical protein
MRSVDDVAGAAVCGPFVVAVTTSVVAAERNLDLWRMPRRSPAGGRCKFRMHRQRPERRGGGRTLRWQMRAAFACKGGLRVLQLLKQFVTLSCPSHLLLRARRSATLAYVSAPFAPLWWRPTDSAPNVHQLRCRVGPPSGWEPAPAITPMEGVTLGLWCGPDTRDRLAVSFMSKAVPGHRMLTWVEAPISVCAFPEPALQPPPTLVHWEDQSPPAALATQLGIDELHTLRGLAHSDAGLARLYTVLARRQHHAWKVFLSLGSAAGEGDELLHLRDDDARARSVFGALALEGP